MIQLKNHIKNSIIKSLKGISNINKEIKEIDCMFDVNMKHFMNNLCNINDCRYLEIGVYKGGSLCSAIYKNKNIKCLGIDNFSQFDKYKLNKQIVLDNIDKFKNNNNIILVEADCWKINTKLLKKFNIYKYDGMHNELCHYKAINNYINNLDDIFIYIIEVWNNINIQNGFKKALKDNKLEVLYSESFESKYNNKLNIIKIFLIKKIDII
tara:strand:- start:357 stop:986 length:630 start_codon:yes stop_codon:yes gene_type:complete